MSKADISTTPIRSRRAVLAGIASAAALPMAAAAAAAAPGIASDSNRDDELIDLSEQITELRKRYDAAEKASRACREVFEKSRPEKPKALLWRVGDPVGYSRAQMHQEAGKNYLWCLDSDLKKLRGKEFRQWAFIGSEDDYKKLGLEKISDTDGMPPVKGCEHLWQSWPDQHRTRRAAELIAAYEEYRSKDVAALEASGVGDAEDVADDLMSKMDEIYARMAEIETSSLSGLRAQAIGLIFHCWGSTISAPEYEEDHLLRRIMSSLSGMPIGKAVA